MALARTLARMRTLTHGCVAGVMLLAALSSCMPSSGAVPPSGEACTVQFRRDALGAAAANGIPPTTDSMNGASVSVHGKLVRTDSEWVILRSAGKTLWIPRSSILLLAFRDSSEG